MAAGGAATTECHRSAPSTFPKLLTLAIVNKGGCLLVGLKKRGTRDRISQFAAQLVHSGYSQLQNEGVIERIDCRSKGGASGFKVVVLGAVGGIGQPLSMLRKINPLVSVNIPGINADNSDMDTTAVVRGFVGKEQLEAVLVGMDLVNFPAGIPRKPGMTRDDDLILFKNPRSAIEQSYQALNRQLDHDLVGLIPQMEHCYGRSALGSTRSPGTGSRHFLDSFQIQISQPTGRTILQWVSSSGLVLDLKLDLERRIRIPSGLQRLLFQGKQLEDLLPLSSYSITRNSSVVVTLRLRGGAAGQSSSARPFSFKDVVHSEIPKPS